MITISWGTLSTVLMAPLVFVLPGWALLELLLPRQRLQAELRPDIASWLILAAGVTLASIPVAFLWLHAVGLTVHPYAIHLILVISAAFILWRNRQAWKLLWRWLALWRLRSFSGDISYLVLLLVTALAVWVRLWVVCGVNVGFWNDSYHHTMITQLILDNYGLFDSWEPYARLRSLTYHFGFHTYTACFYWATHWLTGTETPRTVVLVGQLLNALAALALYPLAVRLSDGRRWVGVVAVLCAGLITPMPMYYVNWGRYTQLAGQVILPIALWFTMDAMDGQRMNVRRMVLAVLVVGGLFLTHYVVFAFYLMFMVLYMGWWLVGRWRRKESWRPALLALLLIGLVTALLFLPQIIGVFRGSLPHFLTAYLKEPPSQEFIKVFNKWRPLSDFVPPYLAGIALLGGLWALVRRKEMAVLLLWSGCLFLMSNPRWLGLPGQGSIENFTIQIVLYIPSAILAAYLIVILLEWGCNAWERVKPLISLVAAGLCVLAAAAGIRQQKNIINPDWRFVTSADEKAFEWVRHNTPQDAKFLISSHLSFDGNLVVGIDAGLWLPLLTGRQTIVPPMSYGFEAGPHPWYLWEVNAMAHLIKKNGPTRLDTVKYLLTQGFSYVFIGDNRNRKAKIAMPVLGDLLNPEILRSSEYFRTIYPPDGKEGGPWIFEIVSP